MDNPQFLKLSENTIINIDAIYEIHRDGSEIKINTYVNAYTFGYHTEEDAVGVFNMIGEVINTPWTSVLCAREAIDLVSALIGSPWG